MITKNFKIVNLGEAAYLPAPEQNEPDGLWHRQVILQSMEFEEEERDEVVATLWDTDALLKLKEGAEVLVTLQCRAWGEDDGSFHQEVDVVEIKRIIELW